MENIANLLGFLAALSLGTERITETIKGFPFLTKWFAVEKPSEEWEEYRKFSIHVVAIGIGTLLAWLTSDQLSTVLGLNYSGFWVYLLFGAMASGGSGLWNSALDIVREINKQKQNLRLKPAKS